MITYDFHREVRRDLDEIWDFIGADDPEAAADLTGRPLRFIVVRGYLIACAPEEKPLWVVAVMHGRRNPRVMAAILRGHE
jgi:plasmid stabilization system protein ParE